MATIVINGNDDTGGLPCDTAMWHRSHQVIYDPMDCQFYTWQLAIAQNLGGRRCG